MQVTPNHLIALAWVARSGSLTAASRALGKTQPAVSAQLKHLSDTVGMQLIVRHRYGVKLSVAGENLLVYAQACVRALEGAEQALTRMRGMELGKLRVLASTSVAVHMLPPALAQFHAKFPGIELVLTGHNAVDAMHALERGDGDLAVVRGPAATVTSGFKANFVTQVLTQDETVLVVRKGHPLSRRRHLRWKELDGIEVVNREPTSATQSLIERIAARENVKFHVKFRTIGVEALKEAVLQGFGAGFISKIAVRRELENGSLTAVRIDAPDLTQHITAAYPTPGQCPPAVSRFVEILAAIVASRHGRPSRAPLKA